MTACSAPPVYWSTGVQRSARSRSTGPSSLSRREVAEPVPGRVDERVHRVRLAACRSAAARARRVQERLVVVERVVAAAGVVDGLGQADGQVLVRDRHDAVDRAVDDRDRRAPVALAADQPVAQAVGDLRLGQATSRPARRRSPSPPSSAGMPLNAPLLTRPSPAAWAMYAPSIGASAILAGRGDDPPDRQPERPGEREVALVVGGDGHDRAGAVAGQHVVGDEDRDPLAVDRVDGVGADGDAGLLAIGRQAIDLGPPAGLRRRRPRPPRGAPGGSASATSGCSGARTMNVAPNSVSGRVVKTRSRSPPGWMLVGRDLELDLGALGPADPVRLLDADRLRPVEAVEAQQLVGVGGRAQEPLLQVALLDQRAAAPAAAVGALDLLARQRPVVGAPVDRRHRAVGQARLQEAQEQPLVPVCRTRGRR